MNLLKTFQTAYRKKIERGWEYIYVWVDIHETMLYPTYKINSDYIFYPYAREVLERLSARPEIKLGLYTCSKKEEIEKYLQFFRSNYITFEFVNKNTDCDKTEYGDFTDKPYYNVLIEDKAGFEPEKDWKELLNLFR
jgi:hypothetical protein